MGGLDVRGAGGADRDISDIQQREAAPTRLATLTGLSRWP